MSWFGWIKGCKPSEKVDFKSKLEHKIVHAKQTPEPIFDLSDCNLKEVPAGIYSWCKVCLKEALLLQDNRITSLDNGGKFKDLSHLKVFDLHNNHLSHLPDGFGKLGNLQILYLNNNSLKNLPKTFDQLQSLVTLNISCNKFSTFPEVLCNLRRLRSLDISCNNVTKLPDSFLQIRTLDTLILTENNIKFPPPDVCSAGVESIMKFLCEKCNIEYIAPSKAIVVAEQVPNIPTNPTQNALVQELDDYWKNLQRKKEEKRKERLETERLIHEQQESQAMVVADLQTKRFALLEDVTRGQSKLEEELLHAQKKKDEDRHNLILDLVEVEQHSNKVIKNLLDMAERSQNVENILETERREREEFEELFLKQRAAADELRRKDVLSAMTQMLQDQQLVQLQEANKQELSKRLQKEENEMNANVTQVLRKKSDMQNETVANLLNEEQFQKEALVALMKAKDSDSLRIRDQIYLIQDELTNLTMLELKQKDLKIDFELSLLEQKREILTQMLLQLMEQQKHRQEEMNRRLVEMEQQRMADEQDYWLIQYQRLMDHKPPSLIEMESTMDEDVRQLLLEANAEEYIPLFAQQKVSFVSLCMATAEQLRDMGVHKPSAVVAIASALRARRKLERSATRERSQEEQEAEPSTPAIPTSPSDSSITEITAHREVECVICMEKQCSQLYLPCGHVCCCETCGVDLSSCPLCRGEINHRIVLRFAM